MANIPSSGTLPIDHFSGLGDSKRDIQGVMVHPLTVNDKEEIKERSSTGQQAKVDEYPELRNQFIASVSTKYGAAVAEQMMEVFPPGLQVQETKELKEQLGRMRHAVKHYANLEKEFISKLEKKIDTRLNEFEPKLSSEDKKIVKLQVLAKYKGNPEKLSELFIGCRPTGFDEIAEKNEKPPVILIAKQLRDEDLSETDRNEEGLNGKENLEESIEQKNTMQDEQQLIIEEIDSTQVDPNSDKLKEEKIQPEEKQRLPFLEPNELQDEDLKSDPNILELKPRNLTGDEIIGEILKNVEGDVKQVADEYVQKSTKDREKLASLLNTPKVQTPESLLKNNPELREILTREREEQKVQIKQKINEQAGLPPQAKGLSLEKSILEKANLHVIELPEQEQVGEGQKGLQRPETVEVVRPHRGRKPVAFSERVAKIDFAKIGDKSRLSSDRRIRLEGGLDNELVAVTDSISILRNKNFAPEELANNQLVNLAFKNYILEKFGPEVVDRLWEKHSELDVLLEQGGPLTRSDIQKYLKEAGLHFIDQEFADKPWANGAPPRGQTQFTEERKELLEKKFGNNKSILRIVSGSPPPGLIDATLLSRYQNKETILDFMDYLELKEIPQDLRSAIWKMQFAEDFATGKNGLSGWKAQRIFKQADAFRDLLFYDYTGSVRNSKEQVQEELVQRLGEHPDKQRINKFYEKVSFFDRGDATFPKNSKDANDNREQIYMLMQYLVLNHGPEMAEKIWNSSLEYRARLGIKLTGGEIISIVKKAQSSSKESFESGQKAIAIFADTELRNSRAIRRELLLDKNAMIRLQEQFRLRATARLNFTGKAPSDTELSVLANECLDQVRKMTGTAGQTKIGDQVKPMRKAFGKAENERLPSWSKQLTAGEWKDLFKAIKKLADTTKLGLVVSQLGLGAWLKSGGENGDLDPEKLKGVSKISDNLGRLQYVGALEYVIGIGAEFRSMVEAIKENRKFEDDAPLAISNLRLQCLLLGLYEDIEKNYDAYDPAKQNVQDDTRPKIDDLEPLDQISQKVETLRKQVKEAEGKVILALKKDPNRSKVALHLVQGSRYVGSLAEVVVQVVNAFGKGGDILSSAGSHLGGLTNAIAFTTSAVRTWQDYSGARKCYKAGKKADRVLEKLFNEQVSKLGVEGIKQDKIYAAHARYREAKSFFKRKKEKNGLIAPKNLITSDFRTDFAKAISRHQRTGEKIAGGTRNLVNAVAYAGSAASYIATWFKAGAILGGVTGTAGGPLGTVIGSAVGATAGLLAGIGTFLAHGIYKNIKAKKMTRQIQEWREALVNQDGPRWAQMKMANVGDDETCMALALHKLIRRDPKMAITEMAKKLVEEKGKASKDQPVTNMLKEGFQPHKTPNQGDEELNDEQKLENAQWHGTIDRLAALGNIETIYSFLDPILRPA